jgi:ATP-dependent DNA helicase DinG
MKEMMKYWPMPDSKPRKTQEEVMTWLEGIPSNIRYILCEIPVGGGKSPIAVNYSAFLSKLKGNAYILTPQKILQAQYEESFDKAQLASLYGKSNYHCASKNTNCDIGAIVPPKCENCVFNQALHQGNASPNLVLNYTLALLLFKYVSSEKMIKRRNLIVFDECHNLESHLVEFNAIQIGEGRCKQFNIKYVEHKTGLQALYWIEGKYKEAVLSMYLKFKKMADDVEAEHEGGRMSKQDIDVLMKFKDIKDHLDAVNEFLSLGKEEIEKRYVYVPDKTYFKFKELYGKNTFNTLVKPMADRFLFLSSTILDKEAFCYDLGINPDEAVFISTDSEFPLDKRPIVYSPRMKMTYGWNNDDKKHERKDMIDAVIETLKYHKNDNGIIHTGSFQITKWLIENIEGKVPHKLMHHMPDSGYDRGQIINEFTEDNSNQPKVLISPSITEGLDLKNDKGRFAICVKVPFPFLGDKWISRRQEISKEWYNRQAMIAIIQGGGRIVRTEGDWGNFYIFDESFGSLLKFMKNKLPKWWLESLTIM